MFQKKRTKWVARIVKNREIIYLGTFEKETQAAKIYDDNAKILFGEFACLNYPAAPGMLQVN